MLSSRTGGVRPRSFSRLRGTTRQPSADTGLAAKLGAGGMGKVYLSYTPGGRPVAIKVIRPEFRRRFAQPGTT